jgi:hypothetical protein
VRRARGLAAETIKGDDRDIRSTYRCLLLKSCLSELGLHLAEAPPTTAYTTNDAVIEGDPRLAPYNYVTDRTMLDTRADP